MPCPDPNCIICDTNTGACLNCSTNFLVDVQGTCKCDKDYFYYEQQCLKSCPDGFYRNFTTNTCLKCLQPCKVCQSDVICSVCNDGYKFVSSLSKCICLNDYSLLNNTKCVESCPSGYYGDKMTYNCEKCKATSSSLQT